MAPKSIVMRVSMLDIYCSRINSSPHNEPIYVASWRHPNKYEYGRYYRSYVMQWYVDSIGTATGFPNIYYPLVLGQNFSWKGCPKNQF